MRVSPSRSVARVRKEEKEKLKVEWVRERTTLLLHWLVPSRSRTHHSITVGNTSDHPSSEVSAGYPVIMMPSREPTNQTKRDKDKQRIEPIRADGGKYERRTGPR